MRPVSFTYHGTVGVSIDRVFELIADPVRMPEWLPNCTFAVPGPNRKGKGDRHRLHFERNGRKADAVIEIIEYVPPTTYGWVEIIHRRGAKTFFKLEFQGGSTRINHEARLDPRHLARLAARPVLPEEKRARHV